MYWLPPIGRRWYSMDTSFYDIGWNPFPKCVYFREWMVNILLLWEYEHSCYLLFWCCFGSLEFPYSMVVNTGIAHTCYKQYYFIIFPTINRTISITRCMSPSSKHYDCEMGFKARYLATVYFIPCHQITLYKKT